MINKKDFETIACNLCGSTEYEVVHAAKYDKETQCDLNVKFRSSGDERLIDQVVKCQKCGLMYINPRLNPDLIVVGYSEGSDEMFISQAEGRAITFEKCLNLIEKYQKRGRILDIGTAGGTFLHVAKKRGWDVYGIEPNKWLCNWGKQNYGIDIRPGTLFDYKFPDNYFEVITLWDVLEHVSDPKKTLNEINRILRPNGILIVNYPDAGSWIAKLMGRRWIFWLSVHLYYFTPKTIKKMLDITGFDILKVKPHFQKLGFGYLVFRMKQYSNLLHTFGNQIVNILHLNNTLIPYWLGQTLIIARKRK